MKTYLLGKGRKRKKIVENFTAWNDLDAGTDQWSDARFDVVGCAGNLHLDGD
jgi:hypothetical protein